MVLNEGDNRFSHGNFWYADRRTHRRLQAMDGLASVLACALVALGIGLVLNQLHPGRATPERAALAPAASMTGSTLRYARELVMRSAAERMEADTACDQPEPPQVTAMDRAAEIPVFFGDALRCVQMLPVARDLVTARGSYRT